MDFADAYEAFIRFHIANGSGKSANRLESGLEHAERVFLKAVWWPGFHNFDFLYPQYEVTDFRDGSRYIDFAYMRGDVRVAIEIDGFGPHWRDISQAQFCDNLMRQNHLAIDGWHVLRFGYADVEKHPRACLAAIQQMLGRLLIDVIDSTGEDNPWRELPPADREIMRLVLSLNRPVMVRDIASHFNWARHAAARHLRSLSESGWLVPARGTQRVKAYQVHPARASGRM